MLPWWKFAHGTTTLHALSRYVTLQYFIVTNFTFVYQQIKFLYFNNNIPNLDVRGLWSKRFTIRTLWNSISLHWRHNGPDGVSNHQPRHCFLNWLVIHRWKKTSKLRVTGLCAGIHRSTVNSPHKWPVTRKMFPFDDVIMSQWMCTPEINKCYPIEGTRAGKYRQMWVAFWGHVSMQKTIFQFRMTPIIKDDTILRPSYRNDTNFYTGTFYKQL